MSEGLTLEFFLAATSSLLGSSDGQQNNSRATSISNNSASINTNLFSFADFFLGSRLQLASPTIYPVSSLCDSLRPRPGAIFNTPRQSSTTSGSLPRQKGESSSYNTKLLSSLLSSEKTILVPNSLQSIRRGKSEVKLTALSSSGFLLRTGESASELKAQKLSFLSSRKRLESTKTPRKLSFTTFQDFCSSAP